MGIIMVLIWISYWCLSGYGSYGVCNGYGPHEACIGYEPNGVCIGYVAHGVGNGYKPHWVGNDYWIYLWLQDWLMTIELSGHRYGNNYQCQSSGHIHNH